MSLFAALDCGTNSTRLLVADEKGHALERLVTITRLGKGVDATGRLDPASIERTIAVLGRYRDVMSSYEIVSARLVATSAARDASNFADFARGARDATGVEPELLSGAEEGALAFRGATLGLGAGDPDGPHPSRLVIDLGGGSTELIAGDPGGDPGFVTSLEMGCVRMTEKFLHHDPPLDFEIEAARVAVTRLLRGALEEARRDYDGQAFEGHGLVGVAGTVTSLCAMSLGLESYDPDRVHHSVLAYNEVKRLYDELVRETAETRREHRGLEKGRADVIASGALVLEVAMRELGFSSLLVSEADILDGLVASQVGGSPA